MANVLVRLTPKVPKAGEEVKLQVILEHPNESGLRVDEASGTLVPRRTVEELVISVDDHPIMTLRPGIGMSTNPTFTVFFKMFKGGKLRVHFRDQAGETGEAIQDVKLA